MEDYIYSKITGKQYAPTKVVRILNTRQVMAYLKMGVELLDMYVSVDRKTEAPLLVYLFDREKSKHAYDLWCKREIE